MFRADFPGFTLKIVEHSRYLLITQFGVVLLGLLHIVFSNCSAWKSVIYGREQVKKYDTELAHLHHMGHISLADTPCTRLAHSILDFCPFAKVPKLR